MTDTNLDVRAYLERIGYRGTPAPDLGTLAALQSHHVRAIAFETIAMALQAPVALDPQALQRKVLHEGRGGYCYELNLLFLQLLRALGFRARGLTGRVLMGAEAGQTPARTHMLLLVELPEGRYVADVGFGGMTPTGPLRLDATQAQATPHEPYRIEPAPDQAFTLYAQVGGDWRPLYRFDLAQQAHIDYEVGNWYVSTHPQSPFRGRLLAARMGERVRHTLQGGRYSLHRLGAASEHREFDDPAAVVALLQDTFGLRVPDGPRLRAAIAGAIGESR